MEPTIKYYDNHAEKYARRFADIGLGEFYSAFTSFLPAKAHILDAGCGPGRDARAFKAMGYRVTAFDASPAMLKIARKDFEGPLHRLRFNELSWDSEFDGVWAMASLLHVPRKSLPSAIMKLTKALVPKGVFFMSFKRGRHDRTKDERLYCDYEPEELQEIVDRINILETKRLWVTRDFLSTQRPDWVNCIAHRRGGG